MTVQVLSDLSISGSVIFAKDYENFPSNPSIGTLVLKEQVLYAYISIGGLSTWYPFASRTKFYIHTQGEASLTWTVNHGLGSTDIWYQVQNPEGNLIIVNKTTVDANTFTLNFTYPAVGTVIAVGPDSINVPVVNSSLIKVGGNDEVVIDTTGVLINGSYALTSASVETDIANAINAEATARANADTTLQNAINNINQTLPYDLAAFVIDKPANNATVFYFVANRSFTIPGTMLNSIAKAGTASTGTAVLSIRKNGTPFATVTFSAGNTTGTVAGNTNMNFVAGDVITITNQTTADATLANIGITIAASLS